MNIIQNRHGREHGLETVTDRSGKIISERVSTQCPHCGAHFFMQVGSGIQRGWCWLCNRVTCGSEQCSKQCRVWEQQMEEIERKATQHLRGY